MTERPIAIGKTLAKVVGLAVEGPRILYRAIAVAKAERRKLEAEAAKLEAEAAKAEAEADAIRLDAGIRRLQAIEGGQASHTRGVACDVYFSKENPEGILRLALPPVDSELEEGTTE